MATTQPPTFGLLLRRHRRAAGLTQEELAEQAGLSVRAIGDLERGVRFTPRRDTLELLIEALQLGAAERGAFEAAARSSTEASSADDRPAHLLEAGNFLGAIPSGPLIGRSQELHRLLTPLEAVAGGHGRLALITGEPGVGKTRMAQEIALEAGKRGFIVATGRYYEPQRAVPLYGYIEALATIETTIPTSIRQEISQRWPHLASLLPLTKPESEPMARVTRGLEEQHRLFQSVSGFLQTLAAVLPVAILLDDLHWADSASLQLLLHLARYTRGSRVLLLGTYRDVEVGRGHPLERALVDLNRERLVERVVVHRLGPEGASALIASTMGEAEVPAGLTTHIHRYTDGNPFFIQEVLRALMERGDIYWQNGRWLGRDVDQIRVPETVRSAIGERLSHLPGQAQGLLFEASVLGQSFGFRDLQRLSGRSEEEVEAAMEAAIAAGLVTEGENDTYAFNHTLTQQALYADLGARRRRRLHMAAGMAVERLSEHERSRRAGELAWHFSAGGDTERAIAYAILAGDRAQQGFAYGEAERYYRDALALARRRDEASEAPSTAAVDAYARLGRVLHITERYDEALEMLEEAAQLYNDRGDLKLEAQMVAEIGWAHSARRTAEEGIERVQPYVSSLEAQDPCPVEPWILAALYTALARLFFGLGQFHDELAAAERAAELARLVDEGITLSVAEARRGAALMTLGRRKEARRVLECAVDLAEASGNIGTASVALDNLAEIHRDAGRFEQSRECLERALELAQRTAVPGRIAWTLIDLGRISFLMGRRQQARDYFSQAAAIFREAERPSPPTEVMLLSWRLIMDEGTQETIRRLEATVAKADRKYDLWMIRYVRQMLAIVDLVEGRPEAAIARLEQVLDRPGLEEPSVNVLLWILAEGHVELGHADEAEAIIASTMRRAAEADQLTVITELTRVRAILRSRQGRWDESRADFDEAIAHAKEMQYRFAQARCLYSWGVMETGAGNLERARELLNEASVIFGELGDRVYAERVKTALSVLPT
jgi:tetratricopeptide (TPR) repeat protein/transcriptional regulator with XRE-family HTH domain